MLRPKLKTLKRSLIVCAALLAAGFATFGATSDAEARGCRGRGYGYGGYGYGGYAAPAVVYGPRYATPVVYGYRGVYAAPVYSGYGFGSRGVYYGGRGVNFAIGF